MTRTNPYDFEGPRTVGSVWAITINKIIKEAPFRVAEHNKKWSSVFECL